ncbi:MAG: hypothetical protein AB1489_19375 [Acidobacteriota bacterium]
MSWEDLDQLLAMELGDAPASKVAKQTSSLENHVLNRVQEACPREELLVAADRQPEPAESTIDNTLEPIYQYVDALLPIMNRIQDLLEASLQIDNQERLQLRTQLAEQLLALPEIKGLDKPSVFAAMATCIDAASAYEVEVRRAANTRLRRLAHKLAVVRRDAEGRREQAIDQFLARLSR